MFPHVVHVRVFHSAPERDEGHIALWSSCIREWARGHGSYKDALPSHSAGSVHYPITCAPRPPLLPTFFQAWFHMPPLKPCMGASMLVAVAVHTFGGRGGRNEGVGEGGIGARAREEGPERRCVGVCWGGRKSGVGGGCRCL